MNATSSQALLRVLAAAGVDRMFLVPGESYLGLLDALNDVPGIEPVTCRHEAGAGFMAIADARLTRRPGVCAVSRGPGASNAAIAVHTAQQDAVPMILLVGQVPVRDLRRDAFQEIDYRAMFGTIAKWVFEPTRPEQLAEVAWKAVRIATAGTPGPVVLAIPEDVQQQMVDLPDWGAAPPAAATLPDEAALAALGARLRAARAPLIIAGGGLDEPGGREALSALACSGGIPVAVSFRRHDLFPNDDPLYVGDLGLANPAAQIAAFQDSDLILAMGTRLDDITTQGFTFPDLPRPRQTLVHCHADGSVIGRHFTADVALTCSPAEVLRRLAPAPAEDATARRSWRARLRTLFDEHARWPERTPMAGVDFVRVVRELARRLSDDAILCLDAGTFAAPFYRHVQFRPPQRLLAPLAGAMGFGVPAAVAAQLRCPTRRVVCVVGDGGFMMTGNEMIAAVERRLPIVFVVADNGSYGSIRIHQERDYPGRTARGTTLFNPDFAAIAAAFGMPSGRVTTDGDIAPALGEAMAGDGPWLVVVQASLDVVLPRR